jgi:hypothetical protein
MARREGGSDFREPPPPAQPPQGLRPAGSGAAVGGGEAPGNPGTGGGRSVVVAIPPFEDTPIPGSSELFRILQTANVIPGATLVSATLDLEIDQGYYGLIAFFSIFCNAPSVTSNIRWAIRANGGPIAGWDAISFSPRAASSFERTFGATIRIPGGTKISVAITNNGVAAEDVGASYGGWFAPQRAVEKYTGLPFLYVR